MKRKAITMTVCSRPQYADRAFAYLKNCEGIEEYDVLVSVDPATTWNLPGWVEYRTNERVMGAARNHWLAVSWGWEEHELVIHTEEDVLLGRDTLRFYEWALDKYKDDQTVLNVAAYSRTWGPAYATGRRKKFTPGGGWATWPDRWEFLRDNWSFQDKPIAAGTHIDRVLRGDRYEIHPMRSRAQNIGAEDGYYNPSPEWHAEHIHLDRWAEDYEPGEYR